MNKLENAGIFFLINGIPTQRGSVLVTTTGEDQIGLAIIGTRKDLVASSHFSDWVDGTDTPYATKQLLLDDIALFCFESNAAGIPDAPSDGFPYIRQNGVWVNDTQSKIVVSILDGQDINNIAGLTLILNSLIGVFPTVNPDFTFVANDSFVTCNRAGFLEISYNINSNNQTNSRQIQACLINKVPGGVSLQTVSYSYSRNQVDDSAQNNVDKVLIEVDAGDEISIFSIRTGSAGAALTISAQCFLSLNYVNNIRL